MKRKLIKVGVFLALTVGLILGWYYLLAVLFRP